MVLVLCMSFDDVLCMYQFHENILDGNKVIEQTRFSLEIFQRGISSQKL